METCLSNKGAKIWEGAKEWAAEKTTRTYDPAIWDAIFNSVDANSDGEVTTAEAIAAMKTYFSITLSSD